VFTNIAAMIRAMKIKAMKALGNALRDVVKGVVKGVATCVAKLSSDCFRCARCCCWRKARIIERLDRNGTEQKEPEKRAKEIEHLLRLILFVQKVFICF
jgi:hypothetical protein